MNVAVLAHIQTSGRRHAVWSWRWGRKVCIVFRVVLMKGGAVGREAKIYSYFFDSHTV